MLDAAPWGLQAMFGGVSCDDYHGHSTQRAYKIGPTNRSRGCKNSWCSVECFQRWRDPIAPYSQMWCELLFRISACRDYVGRRLISRSDPTVGLPVATAWKEGPPLPHEWMEEASLCRNCTSSMRWGCHHNTATKCLIKHSSNLVRSAWLSSAAPCVPRGGDRIFDAFIPK